MPTWSDMMYRRNAPSCKDILEKWHNKVNLPIMDLTSFTYETKILEFGLLECVEEEFLI